MGCSLVCGVKFIGLLSTLIAAVVVGISGWILYDSIQERDDPAHQFGSGLTTFTTNLGITGKGGPLDIKTDLNIRIGVSATTLAAGALQLITSLFLLFCSSSKGGRISAGLWLFVSTFVILATAGSFACLMRKDKYQKTFQHGGDNGDYPWKTQVYLIANLADAVFLFIFSFVTGAFGCRSGGTQA